ncbi:hypothetical protein B296_00003405 [Ensete ventricosum]|uniref:WRKY domain-containing protein n=1 Tax=Ensete ventricosum TaxID=4639 RepID=A0A427B4Y6_ENSVE|nr:hypothetical protein B296_00003405 [Ensete ventricosum]
MSSSSSVFQTSWGNDQPDNIIAGAIDDFLAFDEDPQRAHAMLSPASQQQSPEFFQDHDENENKSKGSLRGSSSSRSRVAFRTKSELEVLDDGYKWRKYGKKKMKNSPNPRNYYRCSTGGCNVKKTVEREREDSRFVLTTYEGTHNHHAPLPATALHQRLEGLPPRMESYQHLGN